MKRNRRELKPQFLARLPPDLEGWLLERASKRTNVSSSSQGVVTRPAAGNTGRVETKEDCETSFLAGSDSVSRQTMRRKDMPLLRSPPSCHGPRVPRDITDDLESRQAALDRFTDDYFAASTRHTRDAQLQTWLRFHNRWFGDTVPPVPLTENVLVAVSCLFKAGGYKSYRNYLGRAKDFHITPGFPWTDALQRVASRCTRSVLRGLGGPTRSEPFDFLDVVKHLEGVEEPLIENGPIFPQVMVVVGVYFMLRELELSAIDVSDLSFSQNDSVTLNLPVSKTDWMAKGCRRTWSCLCSLGRPCPVHVLSAYVKILSDRGQLGGPLIRTIEGQFCTKQAVVDTIRHAVHAAGGLAKSTSGEWVVSGHTFRITGARTLTLWGLDPITVQLLGRWGSSAVLTYLAETPLATISSRLTCKEAGHQNPREINHRIHSQHDESEEQQLLNLKSYDHKLRELDGTVSHLSHVLEGMASALDSRSKLETWHILNDASRVKHETVVDLSMSPATWKTKCGWKFALSPDITRYREDFPPDIACRVCPKCSPSESTSSSSSSSDVT